MGGPAILELGGGQLLLRGLAVVDASRLIDAGIRAGEADGIRQPPRVQQLVAALTREAVAARGQSAADVSTGGQIGGDDGGERASSRPVGTRTARDAAAALGCVMSERTLRRRAGEFGGQLVAGRWTVDLALVEAYAVQNGAPGV